MGIFDVPQNQLVEKVAEKLKTVDAIKPPEWASFAKTGVHKEKQPLKEDWWYMRTASILKTLLSKGTIGVSKLKTQYGGRKNRGYKPERFKRGSGSIARKILQQLEKAGLAKQNKEGKKGRTISPKGVSLLEKTAQEIKK